MFSKVQTVSQGIVNLLYGILDFFHCQQIMDSKKAIHIGFKIFILKKCNRGILMKGQMWSSLKIPLAGGGKGPQGLAINGNKLLKDAAIIISGRTRNWLNALKYKRN